MPKRKGLNLEELLKKEMPTLSMRGGKHFISYLNIRFNHSSAMTYNMEINFKIEPDSGNLSSAK